MKSLLTIGCGLLIAAAMACVPAFAAEMCTIGGTVRDGTGQPVAGARIRLMGPGESIGLPQTVVSGPAGDFAFNGLSAGVYTVSGELDGFVADEPRTVHVSGSAIVSIDLKLTRAAGRALDGEGTASPPVPEFEASGIRGIIDPGGYSASATGAASDLLLGIVDVRRAGRGFAAMQAGDWPCEMESRLRKDLAAGPDHADANRRLGQFYVAHDEPAQAIPFLNSALQWNGADGEAEQALGLALLEQGEFGKARAELVSLSQRRDTPEVHRLVARAEEGMGAFQEAARQYRIADGEAPGEDKAFGIGYELVLGGALADGLAAFEAGVSRYPGSISLRIGKGTAEFLLSRPADSIRSFLAATDIDPSDPRPYSFLANAAAATDAEADSVGKAFDRFLQRAPDSAAANYYAAVALLRESPASDQGRIAALLRRSIELDPGFALAHLRLANFYDDRHDDGDAAPEYEAAVRLKQDLAEAHYRLAMVYRRTGRPELSAKEMEDFRQAKKAQREREGGDALAQFISWMGAGDRAAGAETSCPAIAR